MSDSSPAVDDPAREQRAIRLEILVVLSVTFGLSAVNAALSLLESAVAPGGVGGQTVALNSSQSTQSLIDLLFQLLGVFRLAAWAGLALYLLWRSGLVPRAIGLARLHLRPDVLHGVALAAVIGLPGLGLYLTAQALGINVTLVADALTDQWWRIPALVLSACANSGAEEIVVVAYLLTRLRALGWTDNSALAASALLRGSYHLYQGLGGGIGNVVMGVVFGRYWQRTGRLWPLVIAHAVIDIVAYLGYGLLHGRVSWLP